MARTPLRRAATPEDIADAIAFVARNEYTTGQVVILDGGLTLT